MVTMRDSGGFVPLMNNYTFGSLAFGFNLLNTIHVWKDLTVSQPVKGPFGYSWWRGALCND